MGPPDPAQRYSSMQLPQERTGRGWMEPDGTPPNVTEYLRVLAIVGLVLLAVLEAK